MPPKLSRRNFIMLGLGAISAALWDSKRFLWGRLGKEAPIDAPQQPLRQVPPRGGSASPMPAPASIAPPENGADLVLLNGKIITVDAKGSIAQAVAVKDGKIVKVGTDVEIRGLAGSRTELLDLKGKAVTPGLVDSHLHVMPYGKQFWEGFLNIRYPAVRSKDDLLRLVSEKAEVTPKGQWISGNQGFNLSMADTPNRWELDAVAPDNPVYLVNAGGQYAVVNSYALRLAGINRHTPNPYGGVIGKDSATGEPNGLLFHYPAEDLVRRMVPGWGLRTLEEREEDIVRAAKLCLAAGYTTAHDVIVYREVDVQAYKELANKEKLPMRMHLMLYVKSLAHAAGLVRTVQPFKSGMCTFGGWKLALDGGVAPGTVLMYDTKLPAAKHSYPYHQQEVLDKMVTLLHKSGFQ